MGPDILCSHYTHNSDCRVIQRNFEKSFRIFRTSVSLILDVYAASKKDEISDKEIRLATIS